MPEISRFLGVRICMYFSDHGIPHFHAEHGGDNAAIAIETLDLVEGNLPTATRRIVIEWASRRQPELREAWRRRSHGEPPGRIPPLE